jgi:uncharacterized lipoprotein YehR (DUF1307 family)
MKLIFNKEGNFVLSQKNINKFYIGNDDYIIKEVDNFDIKYTYSYLNDEVVKTLFTPSEQELQDYKDIEEKLKYQQPRKLAYPSIEEQLDKLFHDIDNGTLDKNGQFYSVIKTIKDNNPKK